MMGLVNRMFKPQEQQESPLDRERREFAEDVANIFELTDSGRRVWQKLEADLDSPSYIVGDTHQTAFLEGRRSLIRTFKEAIAFFHTGMREPEQVITQRPKDGYAT